MEPKRVRGDDGWAALRCHSAIVVEPAEQGMNATGTASHCMSRVATSGQTEPAASRSLLTRSTCPAAPSVGSTSGPQRSSLPKSPALSVGCLARFSRSPRPLALLCPAIT